eukprot:scaffold216995_cov28-Tisochrysis_lutea.AAC.6
MSLGSAGTPSRALMKSATCCLTMANPWLSLYAPIPCGMASRYSFALRITSGGKRATTSGHSSMVG